MKKTSIFMSLLLAFAMILTACGMTVPKLIEIAAPDGVLEIELYVGDTTTLELAKTFAPDTVTDEQIAGAMAAANLTWKSDNPEVVEVIPDDGGGGVTLNAKTEGSAIVEVSGNCDEVTLLVTFSVTVVSPVISLQDATMQEELTLTIKEEDFGSEQLFVELTPADATDVEVVFASDDETIATVDEDGIVTAVAVGETVIRAEVIGDFGMTDLYSINLETKVSVIVAPEEITLDTIEGWVYVGGNVQLMPATLPTEAAELIYVYESSDPSIATVSETGLVTGKKVGTAVITVTSEEAPALTATYTITIKEYANNGGGAMTPTQPSNSAPQQPSDPAPQQPTQPDPLAPAPEPEPGDGSSGNPLPFDPLPENPNPGDVGGL